MSARDMETRVHKSLKQLAVRYLVERGCAAAAVEVRCPISRYRVDAAGYLDREWSETPEGSLFERGLSRRGFRRAPAKTIIIECKQARPDFLRDRESVERVLALRDTLEAQRCAFEDRVLKMSEPGLRRSETALFTDDEEWAFEEAKSPRYHQILARLDRLDARLYGGVKFSKMARWRLADELYVMAPRGVLKRREIPPGWGYLEVSLAVVARRPESARGAITVVRSAPAHAARTERRAALLRNIAAAATRTALAATLGR